METIDHLVAKSKGNLTSYIQLPPPRIASIKKWTHQVDWIDEAGCQSMLRVKSFDEAESFARFRLENLDWIIRSIPSIN